MEESILFLNLEGLNDLQVKDLKDLLHPANLNNRVEFPWSKDFIEDKCFVKGDRSSLNVHAPIFESSVVLKTSAHSFGVYNCDEPTPISNITNVELTHAAKKSPFPVSAENYIGQDLPINHDIKNLPSNRIEQLVNDVNSHICDVSNKYEASKNAVRHFDAAECPAATFMQPKVPVSEFKFNPSASSFVPQKVQVPVANGAHKKQSMPLVTSFQSTLNNESNYCIASNSDVEAHDFDLKNKGPDDYSDDLRTSQKSTTECSLDSEQTTPNNSECKQNLSNVRNSTSTPVSTPSTRSWADVLKSGTRVNSHAEGPPLAKVIVENGGKTEKHLRKECETEKSSVTEDKLSLPLGKHLYEMDLDFQPVFLQPRGLINRRNWCYINASLQALLACPPFYTLLRNLPLGPAVERGKSSTPVIDSMVKVAYEFVASASPQEEMQPGPPFQPKHIYEMLGDLKSDCLKGQQEDAEEFLSYILNGMHEEMVAVIKNYEKKHHLNNKFDEESKINGCAEASEGEEEWQVIGSKQKGMVTRKVVEHRTPISELLGGQIKSFVTISGNKTSASVQPFFTLQLDIQSENVSSVLEALNQMSVKEPIQGYTCAKTKQEVEAYSHIALQKLPPILILHLKRFVYNKTGGCKKVMKKTDYPIKLELKRELFSQEVKRSQRMRFYTLFAVMYHDGEEAVKGHYISDIYNHGSKSWIRCDDRAITTVTEDQVLSHSPPRVPYLLFYQVSEASSCSSLKLSESQ